VPPCTQSRCTAAAWPAPCQTPRPARPPAGPAGRLSAPARWLRKEGTYRHRYFDAKFHLQPQLLLPLQSVHLWLAGRWQRLPVPPARAPVSHAERCVGRLCHGERTSVAAIMIVPRFHDFCHGDARARARADQHAVVAAAAATDGVRDAGRGLWRGADAVPAHGPRAVVRGFQDAPTRDARV
jgi:hypothetical protein